VAINYVSSENQADELAKEILTKHGVKTTIIQGNMGLEADCVKTVEIAIERLGGLDIIVSNAGYTRFVTFNDINAPTVEDWDLCYAVNVKAQHILMREATPIFNSNSDGGVFLITSSIAGVGMQGSSMPYSVTKAAQLHLMRCLAFTQAPKIRVNAVLPGILLTEWGNRYPKEKIAEMKEKAWLKRETDLDDTAQAYIDAAKNSSMTGQKIQVDSGLLNV